MALCYEHNSKQKRKLGLYDKNGIETPCELVCVRYAYMFEHSIVQTARIVNLLGRSIFIYPLGHSSDTKSSVGVQCCNVVLILSIFFFVRFLYVYFDESFFYFFYSADFHFFAIFHFIISMVFVLLLLFDCYAYQSVCLNVILLFFPLSFSPYYSVYFCTLLMSIYTLFSRWLANPKLYDI